MVGESEEPANNRRIEVVRRVVSIVTCMMGVMPMFVGRRARSRVSTTRRDRFERRTTNSRIQRLGWRSGRRWR